MGGAVEPGQPAPDGRYRPWRRTRQAKTANYHFALGLQQQVREGRRQRASLLAHPGLSNTDLQSRTVREGGGGCTARSSRHGQAGRHDAGRGRPPAASGRDRPEARGGELYAPRFGNNGPAVRRPILRRWDLQQRIDELWQVSERETGVVLDVAATAR